MTVRFDLLRPDLLPLGERRQERFLISELGFGIVDIFKFFAFF